MAELNRKIKELSNEFQVPESYCEKVDEILEKIREDSVVTPRKKIFMKMIIVMAVICVIITGLLFSYNAEVAEAGFLENFKQSIMDYFGMSEDELQDMGIEGDEKDAVSRQDLMFELQEVVMDTQNIYALIRITAPAGMEFKQGMTFDYFGFCEGTNYNVSNVVGGPRECNILEMMESKKNIATFVIDIAADRQIKEGKDVTVFFQNLIAGPYKDKPEVLVEGMWSLSFTASYTNSKEITVKGTDAMKYSFAGTTADIKKIKLLPLGITLISDVSRVDTDTRHTADTRFAIRLKMIDGSEKIVDSPNLEDDILVDSESVEDYDRKGRTYQKYIGQFKEAVNIDKVLGIYIADYYVPLKKFE